ncbi:SRPBCC family protein [Pseudonocardia eucalypti]|uniref:SRPBCC family protein n=1 Tax=Pseudonocardia eucalypti TaxID=648755 RepID=A0ABP9PRM1_9PSEU|nr:hypothetical protein [Pseudonocardia eucalypti]
MAKAQCSKNIAASQEKVWRAFTDLGGYEKWMTIHDRWHGDVPGELAEGGTATQQATIMGMANKIDWTIQELAAPSRLKMSGTGLAGARVTFVLNVTADGPDASVAEIDAEFISQMMVGAIGDAVERATNKELAASLDKLAGLVA